jgi:hypothetical protein
MNILDIIPGNQYPIEDGISIDFNKYGMMTDHKFTVKTSDGKEYNNCIYEGYGDLFSRDGDLINDITHFTLQSLL